MVPLLTIDPTVAPAAMVMPSADCAVWAVTAALIAPSLVIALAVTPDMMSIAVDAASSEILTRPIGVTGQGDFHNQLLRLRAPQAWPPQRWLRHCRDAERDAGRRDSYHWGPRRADVDLVLLGEAGDLEVSKPGLTVPHPEIANRPFITRLLNEIRAPSGM